MNYCIMNALISDSLRPFLAITIILLGLFAAVLQLGPLWVKLAPSLSLPYLLPQSASQVAVVPVLVVILLTCLGLSALMLPEAAPQAASPAVELVQEPDESKNVPAAVAVRDKEEELSESLDRILSLLNSHSELSRVYSLTLEHAGRNLIEATSPEQLRIAIGLLVAENNKMRKETNELQNNLRESQERVEMLRSNLHHAEVAGMRDGLTNVWNRRAFDTMIDQQVAQAPLAKRPLSLTMVDIDHFKSINDRFGHPVGDEVLRLVASVLQRNLKGRDFVARYGGEEFALLMPQTTVDAAVQVAQQIRQQLLSLRYVSPQTGESIGQITASFGVAQLKPSEGKRGFIQRADSKLYEAKSTGRNKVVS